jgi:hypothetical protein
MSQSLIFAESELLQPPDQREIRPSERGFKIKKAKSPSTSLPRNLKIDTLAHAEVFPTGIGELDQLLGGGIPRGKLTEISGKASSGKTGVLLSILAQVTRVGEIVAYVDTYGTLDPECARNAGIDLASLLWVRCQGNRKHPPRSCERALKATDILVQGGGVGAVVLDVESFPFSGETRTTRVPFHIWLRLQRAVKGTQMILVVLSRAKTTGSAASLALSIERDRSVWTPRYHRGSNIACHVTKAGGFLVQHQSSLNDQYSSHPFYSRKSSTNQGVRVENQLQGIESRAHLLRGNSHGTVAVHCRFQPET